MGEASNNWTQVIGIVGGLGPHAHLAFERHLLEASGPIDTEQEYPQWILVSSPSTPDRTACIRGKGPSPVKALTRSLETLQAAGADFAVIACNAAHYFLPSLLNILPILDIVAAGLRAGMKGLRHNDAIGVLATTGTLMAKVYQDTASKLGFVTPLRTLLDLPGGPDLQEGLVMEPIYGSGEDGNLRGLKQGVIGEVGAQNKARLREAAQRLVEAGSRSVIMGCTEIPLALQQADVPGIPLIDPLVSAATAAVAIARGKGSREALVGASR